MSTTTIPAADEIRQQIRARVDELRALRKLLRLAEALKAAGEARRRQSPLSALIDNRSDQEEAEHA